MSIKKILTILLATSILLSLGLFAFFSQSYMHTYFNNYIDEKHHENVDNIISFSINILKEGPQQRSFLNSYIQDPIYYVEIYDINDNFVMNSGLMGKHFVYDDTTMTTETYKIEIDGAQIGIVNIAREINIYDTTTIKLFDKSLLFGGIISVIAVILVVSIILFFAIKFISKSINKVVEYAIDDGITPSKSKIYEITTITNAIKEYRNKLKIKEHVKKQKFDQLLHETKTPITILQGQLEGAIDSVVILDKDRIESMLKEINNLDTMLKNVTNIIEGVQLDEEVILEDIEYSNEIEKIVNSLTPKFKNKNLELIFNKSKLYINANKNMLNKVIYNLLLNAYKYTDTGNVTITADNINKTISIKDTGRGIKPFDIKHIFEPYYRGSNIQDVKGEGLGLYTAKEYLEQMGFSISVMSVENKYTEFILTFIV